MDRKKLFWHRVNVVMDQVGGIVLATAFVPSFSWFMRCKWIAVVRNPGAPEEVGVWLGSVLCSVLVALFIWICWEDYLRKRLKEIRNRWDG